MHFDSPTPYGKSDSQWASGSWPPSQWSPSRLNHRWTAVDNVPRLVLVPKAGSSAAVAFLNSCTGGHISPTQALCRLGPCHRTGNMTLHAGDIDHQHRLPDPSLRESVFVVIRHPVDRFLSLVEYRLAVCYKNPLRRAMLPCAENATNISHTIDQLSDDNMKSFVPFRTLTEYVGQAAEPILCSVDELAIYDQKRLHFTGCANVSRVNPSPRTHGKPRPDQLVRVARVLQEDLRLWERACGRGRSPGV